MKNNKAGGKAPETMKEARAFVSCWLEGAMAHAGVNQSELARRLGYEPGKVNRMVHESRSMSAVQVTARNGANAPLKVAQVIEEAFGVCERLSLPAGQETITRLVAAILAEDGSSR